ncbi:MAG TPA: peptidoglycan-associated lipoprotein Pal [Burkholderiales bacterium]|jgi:peptidoglycan-associated lipoprotein|nr:peptidoglycan-associated lipoprotein Pal [Burkholderiales bacterium]
MKKLFLSLAILGFLAGCASTDTQKSADVTEGTPSTPPPVEATKPPPPTTVTKPLTPPDTRGGDPLDPLNPKSMLNQQRSVFFDYDSFVIKDEYKPMVTAHSRYLVANRAQKITIEGNTDERGSREYNIALGQKRADSVRQMMVLLGVKEDQIETISFGEEKPRNQGHDEAAFSQNRRSDIRYAGDK